MNQSLIEENIALLEEGPVNKTEEMRKLSNVIQALENLITQCADSHSFDHVLNFSQQALRYFRQRLHREIHQL